MYGCCEGLQWLRLSDWRKACGRDEGVYDINLIVADPVLCPPYYTCPIRGGLRFWGSSIFLYHDENILFNRFRPMKTSSA